MSVIPAQEATTVKRPKDATWEWPPHIYAMVSDSVRFFGVGNTWKNGGPMAMEVALNFTESLYRSGYAIVRLNEENADG